MDAHPENATSKYHMEKTMTKFFASMLPNCVILRFVPSHETRLYKSFRYFLVFCHRKSNLHDLHGQSQSIMRHNQYPGLPMDFFHRLASDVKTVHMRFNNKIHPPIISKKIDFFSTTEGNSEISHKFTQEYMILVTIYQPIKKKKRT